MTTVPHSQYIPHDISDPLISTAERTQMMEATQGQVDRLQVSMGSLLSSFFSSLRTTQGKQTSRAQIDFWSFDDSDYLEELRWHLEEYRAQTSHKYKKLHYTYLISRVSDRLIELETNAWQKMQPLDLLSHQVRLWDLALISSQMKGFSLKSLLNQLWNGLLRFFSQSMFAHIGIVGRYIDEQWRERLHSTLHTDGEQWAGVQKLLLLPYISHKSPCDLLVLQVRGASVDQAEWLVSRWERVCERGVWYDTWDAIADVTWWELFRSQEKMNCGMFVYHCVQAVTPSFSIDEKAVPVAYLGHELLEQRYMGRV